MVVGRKLASSTANCTESLVQRARPLHHCNRTQIRSLSLLRTSYSRPLCLARPRPSILTIMAAVSPAQRQRRPGDPEANNQFTSFRTVNFYAGNQLSRLSWLRNSSDFLNAAITSERTRFILLDHLNPLVYAGGSAGTEKDGTLATLSWEEVKDTILASLPSGQPLQTLQVDGKAVPAVFGPHAHGIDPSKESDENAVKFMDKQTQGLGPPGLALVFLGVDEAQLTENSMPGRLAKESDGQEASQDGLKAPAGIPYFALSLSYRSGKISAGKISPVESLAQSLTADGKHDFVDTRSLAQAGSWPLHDAAVVASARSLIDWNERHQYCPACSRRQYSLWAGWKRACASALGDDVAQHASSQAFVEPLLSDGKSFKDDGKGECPTPRTLSNFCYPRTDPTVIMGIVSPDNERLLLGRQRKWPKGFYSCLAGFLEPGESLEEAVRREIFEESGVHVGQVTYHSSQPWPFPANLMMGAIGQAVPGKDTIRLDLDTELEDAKFFTRAEILAAVEAAEGYTFSKRDLEKVDENYAAREAEKQKRLREQQQQDRTENNTGDPKFDQKDSGSVANVTDRAGSPDGSKGQRPGFKIPGPTAIAHVLIAAWARGEAHFAPDARKTRM